MSDTVTAWDNIYSDFGWIGNVTEWLGDLGIFLGVLIAWRQLNSWRREQSMRRKSEVAEELIALAFNADDALKDMRNPMSSVPADKAGNRQYYFEQRYKTVAKYNDLFRSLRDAQIRLRTVTGNEAADKAVDVLFQARARVATAIEMLADYERDNLSPLSDDEKNDKRALRKELYGSFGSRDEFGQEILTAIEIIEKELSPIARLEAGA